MIAVTSPGFVLFAALLAGLWYVCPPPRRWQLMLGANLVFYAVLCWQALPVLLACTFLVWWCGRRTAAKGTFYAGLAAALFPLLLLKYLPAAFGWQGKLANALGIGYFTLQLISYLCDVRRGKLLPEEQYARLLCYASFFLSITQGPFNRYDELMPQMDRPARWDTARVWRGVQRSAWGYFKKLAVADRAAVVVDAVFANPAAYDRTQLLLGSVLFTVQLYADFSGYTDIVLGVGEVLGLTLPENFRQPFFADSVKDIWARWHISLSQWLRDYVYIPLGGKKKHRLLNMAIVWALTGMWHGASWNFVLWGLYFFVILTIEKQVGEKSMRRVPYLLRRLGTMLLIIFGWNIFYYTDMTRLVQNFGVMFGLYGAGFSNAQAGIQLTNNLPLLLLCAIGATSIPRNLGSLFGGVCAQGGKKSGKIVYAAVSFVFDAALLALSTIALVGSTYNAFLYFRF